MLNKIGFWTWYLIIAVGLYLVYNPTGFSLVHMWMFSDMGELLPLKLLGSALLMVFMGLIIHGTWRSIGVTGLAIVSMLLMILIWSIQSLTSFNVLDVGIWSWIAQPIVAVVLTLGWQWPKIWRRSTGAVSVEDPDTGAAC